MIEGFQAHRNPPAGLPRRKRQRPSFSPYASGIARLCFYEGPPHSWGGPFSLRRSVFAGEERVRLAASSAEVRLHSRWRLHEERRLTRRGAAMEASNYFAFPSWVIPARMPDDAAKATMCFTKGAQSGLGVCGVSDTWWARMVDASWRSASFERFVFREHGRRSGLSCGGTARSASRRWAATVLPPIQSWCSWESMTTDGGGAKAQAAAGARAVPAQSRREEAERRVAGRAERGYRGLREGVFFYAFAHSRTLSQADVWCCTLCPGALRGKNVRRLHGKLRGVPLGVGYNDAIRSAAAGTDVPWSILPHTVLITMR